MNVSFENSFRSVSLEEVELYENELNVRLPEDYKRFVLKNNGGKPVARRFKTKDGKHISSLMLFFPLTEDIEPNIISIFKEFNKNSKIPANLLVIGEDPIKNKICLSFSGSDDGAVYYWSLDMEDILEEDYIPSYTNFSLISSSFTEFVQNLSVLES